MKTQLKSLYIDPRFFLFLIFFLYYCMFLSFFIGYFLSQIFYNFLIILKKNNLFEIIKLRKNFSIKNIIKKFFSNFFKKWLNRIKLRFDIFIDTIVCLFDIILLSIKNLKSFSNFKDNFLIIIRLLNCIIQTFQNGSAFWTEIFFFHYCRKLIKYWLDLIAFLIVLMQESIILNSLLYIIFFIIFGIFGMIMGFLFGLYKIEKQFYSYYTCFLLEILYRNNIFDPMVFSPLPTNLFIPYNFEEISKLSFQFCESSKLGMSNLFFNQFEHKSKNPIHFPIIRDSIERIEIEISIEKFSNYKFKLFRFFNRKGKGLINS